jgi:hypothetical protein
MRFYTIFLEWKGGTYIAQERAESVPSAIEAWAQSPIADAIPDFGPSIRDQIVSDLESEAPVPISALSKVWCHSALSGDDLALIHIVQTEQ